MREANARFLIAFSCKGRGGCPSCNARRMVDSAGAAPNCAGYDERTTIVACTVYDSLRG